MRDDDVHTALNRHWAASDANDFVAEHEIYRDDVLGVSAVRRAHPADGTTSRRRGLHNPTPSTSRCVAHHRFR